MGSSKISRVLVMVLFLHGCATSNTLTDTAVAIVAIPFKIVGLAVAAAIGAAAGMGTGLVGESGF